MTAEQFAYWMQGFVELSGDALPSAAQWKSIREHLERVFVKVTPEVDFSKLRIGDPPASAPYIGQWWRSVNPNCAEQRPAPMRSECSTARFEPLANGADTV